MKVKKAVVYRIFMVAMMESLVLGIFAFSLPVVSASAKSLYLVADHHYAQFDAWNINPDGSATYQASFWLSYATDPAGVAIDESSKTLFVTSEFSGGVEMIDATTLTSLGVSSGPTNLAGVDVDDANDIVYAVERYTNNLYAFDWDPVAGTLTPRAGFNPYSLPGCSGAFGIAFDSTTDILWVADGAAGVARAYDVNTWTEDLTKSFTPSHLPIDIAVDRVNQLVYTVSMSAGAWTPPGAGSTILSKYDLATATETTGSLADQGVGVAVDEVTGLVYVTLSPYGRGLSQGDLEVWNTFTTPWTLVSSSKVSGSPAGICIPRKEVAYTDVTIKAYCGTEGLEVSVSIAMDGSPTGYYTPHTFSGLSGAHTFTVPSADANGHPFREWSTGATTTTITVVTGGIYTAYYGDVDITIDAYCYLEEAAVSVSITMDGSPTSFYTPHTFTGLAGIHTFSVPLNDINNHWFSHWNTMSTSTTITVVARGGTYTAYYGFDPTHLIIDTISEPESLDPAWANDPASRELIFNVYETLVSFNKAEVDEFVPKLATSWNVLTISETSPEGLTWVKRLSFTIRSGVKFHDGVVMTPEDVEYSFERLMVQDRNGGPSWMVFEPLLDTYRASNPSEDPNFGLKIDHAVEDNATHVWFNLVSDFPTTTFMQILSHTLGSVIERTWAEALGDLNIGIVPGGWANWDYIWNQWHDPQLSFIEGQMIGTGPYKLYYWNHGVAWSIIKFDNYWEGWTPPDISRATWNYIPEWATRRLRFEAGISDVTFAPRMFRDQLLGQPGIKSNFPFQIFSLDAFFFTFDISPTSPYAPTWYPPDTFGINGVPPNIFGKHSVTGIDEGLNVRKGFAYAFDYARYLAEGYLNEGQQPASPVIGGLEYNNPAQANHSYDLNKAEYYLKLAWGGVDLRSGVPGQPVLPEDPTVVTPGAVWANGMSFTIVFNEGNVARDLAAFMLESTIEGLNPLFTLSTIGMRWGPVYLPQMVAHELPLFISGWTADFTDPHDLVHSFMHSQGTFTSAQLFGNPRVDALIEAGILTPDDTLPYNGELDYPDPRPYFDNPGGIPPDTRWPRRSIYYELQAIYHDDVPSVPVNQPLGRYFMRDWVQGWYCNPLHPSEPCGQQPCLSIRSVWKGPTPHDVAVTDIQLSKTIVGQGYSMSISVTAENQGNVAETFAVTAYYDSNAIGSQTVTLTSGSSTTVTFTWVTTGVGKGSYTIGAYAEPVPGETDTIDNPLANGIVKVVTPGDVNADGVVDILDVGGISAHWYPGPPIGPLGYDLNFDINDDGVIDIFDAAIVSAHWTGPPKGPLDP